MNFVDKIAAGELRAEIPLVVASRPDCGGIGKAERAGLRCEIVPRKMFAGVEGYSETIFELCRAARADLVALAGFLTLIRIPDDFELRVMNVHPALIPAFCGKGFHGHRVHDAVLERGVKVSGCTIHFADNEYDHGPIIVQRCVPVLDRDTPETLAERVFAAECEVYPEAIRRFAEGRLEFDGTRVLTRGE